MGEKLDTGDILLYLRDETGAVVGLKYRMDSDAEGVYRCYFFEKNLQGDVVAMYDDAGKLLGGYTLRCLGKLRYHGFRRCEHAGAEYGDVL